MKKMRTLILIVIVFLVLLTIVSCVPIKKVFRPELVDTFPLGYDFRKKYAPAFMGEEGARIMLWFPVSENPYTEANVESLQEYTGDDYIFDFDEYTYAISLGCEITKIQKAEYYGLGTENFGEYHFGEAIAFLSENCSGEYAYLYRIPKDWIDIKYYEHFDGNYCLEK